MSPDCHGGEPIAGNIGNLPRDRRTGALRMKLGLGVIIGIVIGAIIVIWILVQILQAVF